MLWYLHVVCLVFGLSFPQAQFDQWTIEHFQRAQAAQASNRLDDAASEYKLVISRNPTFAEGFLNLGIVYHLQGRYVSAIRELKLALKLKPQLIQAQILLGITYYMVQNYDSALHALDAVLKINPAEKQARFYSALTLLAKDDPEDAADRLQSLGRDYPNDLNITFQLGEAYRQAAAKSALILSTESRTSALYEWGLAISAEEKNDRPTAILHYATALAADGNIPQIYERLAVLFETSEAPELAAEVRARFFARTPTPSEFTAEERKEWFGARTKLVTREDYLSLWDKLQRVHPTSDSPRVADSAINLLIKERLESGDPPILRKAVDLYEQGDCSDAVAFLKSGVASAHWVVVYLLARSYFCEKDPDAAENIIQRYLKAQRKLPSIALLELEIFSVLAARSYDEVLTTAPDSNQARILRAKSLAAENRINESIAQYREVLNKDPNFEQLHLAIGQLFLDQGNWAAAVEEFLLELQINPENRLVQGMLGHAYTEAEQPDLAIPILKRVLIRSPDDARALSDYGRALTRKGETTQAIQTFEKALKQDPSAYHIHYLLFQLYRSRGQEQLAREHLSIFQMEEAKNK